MSALSDLAGTIPAELEREAVQLLGELARVAIEDAIQIVRDATRRARAAAVAAEQRADDAIDRGLDMLEDDKIAGGGS